MRMIKTLVCSLLVAGGGVALADPAPAGPDFEEAPLVRGDLNRDMTTSDGDGQLQPVDLVLFGFDSSALDRADVAELGPIVEWAHRNPTAKIVVEGYADPSGGRAYNQRLSELRADAVRTALLDEGVPAAQIQVAAFGEDKPMPGGAANARQARIWGQLPGVP